MSIAHCLENYLGEAQVSYNLIAHGHTESAYDSARSAHIPTASVVKAVLLRNRGDGRYVLALLPAGNRLKLPWASRELEADLILAKEAELADVFPDCATGAIPGFGQAYDMDLIWDDELSAQAELFFEAGDHEELIKIDQAEFQSLFGPYPHAGISLHHESYAQYHADEIRGRLH